MKRQLKRGSETGREMRYRQGRSGKGSLMSEGKAERRKRSYLIDTKGQHAEFGRHRTERLRGLGQRDVSPRNTTETNPPTKRSEAAKN